METRYFEKLEFNLIRKKLESFAVTFIGKSMALNLIPFENKKDVEKSGKQTTEASILIYRKGNLPISEIENITIHLKKLNSNNFLSLKQLLDLTNILKISRNLKEYFSNTEIDMSEFENLNNLFENLYSNSNIENQIFTSILDENTLNDKASSTLSNIRKNIRNKEQEIKNKLNSFLHHKYIQEPVITTRNGRYVIPVKNEHRSEVKGFIHDTSSSGSTLFIEPISVFDLNNEINNLRIDENIEIEKILQKLSSLFLEIINELKNNINLIGIIDLIFAKAKYSIFLNGSEAKINNEKYINLINAYHPLLDQNTAIKNTIQLGKDYNSLIITGPNTGGKTVNLKTVGLLCLMAMCGLHIPAKEGSSVYIFDNIFADIGDEQSISDSLSTFSSHMTNIAVILEKATENSLVLLDELGSGTDPIQGANLAISILEELHSTGSLCISTTHYPELKHFAIITEGFENASVEFNLETLSPTYKLLLGIPGTSNAFEISKKLGISDKIISRAKAKLNDDSIHIEDLLKEIYENKKIIEQEKENIIKNSEYIKNEKLEIDKKSNELSEKENTIIQKAKEKATSILLEAKQDADEIIKTIQSSDNKEANKQRTILKEKINKLSTLEESKKTSNPISPTNLKIGKEVFVPKLNQNGNIISINGNNIMVQIGIIKSSFKINELEESKNIITPKEDFKPRTQTHNFKVKSISPEINVLGQTVDEACFVIDKYLDNCVLNGLLNVRIVHGKGTGALRTGIHKFLKTHPHVKSFRLGTFGEGEMGVTIVDLK